MRPCHVLSPCRGVAQQPKAWLVPDVPGVSKHLLGELENESPLVAMPLWNSLAQIS
jgi:hypothetical protein